MGANVAGNCRFRPAQIRARKLAAKMIARKTQKRPLGREALRPDAFTLVEVLIALAVGTIVLLPALALCSAALRESSRAQRRAAAFVTADALAWAAAANVRANIDVPERRVVQHPVRTIQRAKRPETADAPWRIETEATPDPSEAPLTLSIATFPPVKPDSPAPLATPATGGTP